MRCTKINFEQLKKFTLIMTENLKFFHTLLCLYLKYWAPSGDLFFETRVQDFDINTVKICLRVESEQRLKVSGCL